MVNHGVDMQDVILCHHYSTRTNASVIHSCSSGGLPGRLYWRRQILGYRQRRAYCCNFHDPGLDPRRFNFKTGCIVNNGHRTRTPPRPPPIHQFQIQNYLHQRLRMPHLLASSSTHSSSPRALAPDSAAGRAQP